MFFSYVNQTKRDARCKSYKFNTDAAGDLKLTRNLLIDNNLTPKTNVIDRPADCQAQDLLRFATMPPDVCESIGVSDHHLMTGLKLRHSQTGAELSNNRATMDRRINNQVDPFIYQSAHICGVFQYHIHRWSRLVATRQGAL